MPQYIDLDPGKFESRRYDFRNNVSEAIVSEFNESMRGVISAHAARPVFDVETVTRELLESIDEAAPTVFSSRYSFEQEWDINRPLHELLGRLALVAESVPDLVPSEHFVNELRANVRSHQEEIETLKHLHDAWPPKTFEYFLEIDSVTASGDADRGDKVYEIAKRMSFDNETLTPDLDRPEALLLLTYLPRHLRQLTRRLLVGNFITARVERALGDSPTHEEDDLLAGLRRYYMLENLQGEQWEAKYVSGSEDTQVEIARHGAEQFAVLGKLQQVADEESGRRLKDIWKSETKDLSEITEAADSTMKTRQWQQIDVGHAFGGFFTDDLFKAFRIGIYSTDEYEDAGLIPKKSGLRAAILEDDDSQRLLWRETVQNSTSFSTEDNLTFTSPESIDAIIDDPTIGLFLLDIQNGDDLMAGIRIGEEVLRRRRHIPVRKFDSSGRPVKAKIIIWSASLESVNLATLHFKQIIEESMPNVAYRLEGRGSRNGDGLVEIEVRRKSWNTYVDIG